MENLNPSKDENDIEMVSKQEIQEQEDKQPTKRRNRRRRRGKRKPEQNLTDTLPSKRRKIDNNSIQKVEAAADEETEEDVDLEDKENAENQGNQSNHNRSTTNNTNTNTRGPLRETTKHNKPPIISSGNSPDEPHFEWRWNPNGNGNRNSNSNPPIKSNENDDDELQTILSAVGLAAEAAIEHAVDTLENNETDSDTNDVIRIRKIPKGQPLDILSLQTWEDWDMKHFEVHKTEDLALIALDTTPYTPFDILKGDGCGFTKPQFKDTENGTYFLFFRFAPFPFSLFPICTISILYISDLHHFHFVDSVICSISIL